jgi:hypothetical protein
VIEEHPLSACAVLFAIPTDRPQFDAQAKTSDYLRKLLRGRISEIAWREDYENVAAAAQGLINTAHEFGVRVYERANKIDLDNATRSCRVVILFAHWRGAKVEASDLLAEPELILASLKRHECFRGARTNNTAGIVDMLNGAISDMRLLDDLPATLAVAARRSRSIGQTLCRDLIDEYLSGSIVPGNRLELFNELCTPDEVEQAIFVDFNGELDLALCHSEALATFIDIRRANRVRHLHWPNLVHPGPQLLKVTATLKRLAAEGGDYIDKRLSIEEAETNS